MEPQSWLDNASDVSWLLKGGETGRSVRAGVRWSARGLVLRAAGRYLYGDWTAAMLDFACGAAELAPAEAAEAWVTRENFAAVQQVVERHRRHGETLFHAGAFEDTLQLGSLEGSRREGVPTPA